MILVIGSINMDVCLKVSDIPSPGETILAHGIEKNPGGKGANQAVSSAKLGGDVIMLGCVGDDAYSEQMLQSMNQAGVNTQYILRGKNLSSSSAYICISDAGENSIVVDSSANMLVTPEYIFAHEELFKKAQYCVLQMEIPANTVSAALELCQKYHVQSVLNPSPVNEFNKKLIRGVNYLIPNENEATSLLGKTFNQASEEDWQKYMEKYQIDNVIVTMGKQGCQHFSQGSVSKHYLSRKRRVVDTTGAGDTFLGAFVSALAEEFPIEKAFKFANTASGISVTRFGAQQAMPIRKEVEYELEKNID